MSHNSLTTALRHKTEDSVCRTTFRCFATENVVAAHCRIVSHITDNRRMTVDRKLTFFHCTSLNTQLFRLYSLVSHDMRT